MEEDIGSVVSVAEMAICLSNPVSPPLFYVDRIWSGVCIACMDVHFSACRANGCGHVMMLGIQRKVCCLGK